MSPGGRVYNFYICRGGLVYIHPIGIIPIIAELYRVLVVLDAVQAAPPFATAQSISFGVTNDH
jgi:hypothetical protein